MTTNLDERARRLVANDVQVCLSGLVSTLANAYGDATGELGLLAEEAFELSTPIPDYEEAAIQNGWTENNEGEWTRTEVMINFTDDNAEDTTEVLTVDSAEEACDMDRIDASDYEREIYEHWAVSDWLGRKLSDYGEKVGYFDNFTVWARTCTGQAIHCDWVIQRIAADLLRGN